MAKAFPKYCALGIALASAGIGPSAAHGIVGPRFFPATLTTDDPFAADELALPTISSVRHLDDGTPTTETEYSFEYAKTIVPGFAISFEDGLVHATPAGGPSVSGFDNLEVTPSVEFARNADHEFIASAGLGWEIGGTGAKAIAESASSFTPQLHIGKGFGDLPDSAALLRPFAVTGGLGYTFAAHSGDPDVLEWSGALEYSLTYLQTNVRDVGLGSFLSRVTPLVEFDLTSPLGTYGGKTTGTIDPGLIWSGQYIQVGAEAILPVNKATGSHIGVIAQLHFYIDDIFPNSLGRPLFGGGA